MSASQYYGSSSPYPNQPTYAAPQQNYYSSSNAHGRPTSTYSNTSGYVPPAQAQYANNAAPASYDQRQTGGQQADGDKGLMATVIGGGAGGALGHKVGKGSKFKTLLGAAAGAVVANAVENKIQGHHGHHGGGHHGHHSNHQGGMAAAPVAGFLGPAGHHGSGGHGGGHGGGIAGLLGGSKPHGHHGHHSHHGHHHSHHGHHGGW